MVGSSMSAFHGIFSPLSVSPIFSDAQSIPVLMRPIQNIDDAPYLRDIVSGHCDDVHNNRERQP